ncbi:hypothetical protein [Nocardiopsis sp. NRRL B-16309]|uniref:hypothetical protein n=1 Tax=Nocardiopsis sp. NRRL B-16309 TaxID=1519494 RepID=UPI0006B0381F|nr:hypothetical protein [Nocardiopsis sp. NRRL B-16309]
MSHEPPHPAGLSVRALTGRQIDDVLHDVFVRGARCRLLDTGTDGLPGDPAAPQWLLAELGDGRVTGACPRERWRRSDEEPTADLSAPALDPGTDRWRVLEVLVFGPHAQIRLGEGAENGWISADAPDAPDAPDHPLRPRDRSLLLLGWNGPDHSRTLPGAVPVSVTAEPSGAQAVLPVRWHDFSGRARPERGGRSALESTGTWLTVREYWAADSETGAVGVAFHRLTGLRTGTKPTGPEFDAGTGDLIQEADR